MLKAFAALLILAGLSLATEAQAQGLFRRGAARRVESSAALTMGSASTAPVFSYSYYTRSNLPVRTYVGYGNDGFPYHGSPYGHPYDPYTWSAMSGSYQAELSRYYAPVLK